MALPHKNKSSAAATGLVVLLLDGLLVATPEALLCLNDGSGGSPSDHSADILDCASFCVGSGAPGGSCSEAADRSIRCRCCGGL